MIRIAIASVLIAAAVMLAVSPAQTAPKPAELPESWELSIDLDSPRSIMVTLPGQARPSLFWYLRYTVTNRTDDDQIYVPELVLYTDTGKVLHAGQKVPIAVFKAIKKLYNDPLLKDMTGMTGKLLQGEDNAKNGVAIWRDFDPKAGAFDIFIGGLSGETAEVKLPKPITVREIDIDGTENIVTKETAILSKTLQLHYSVPGEAAARPNLKPKLKKKQWVMR